MGNQKVNIWQELVQGFDPHKNSDDFYFDVPEARKLIKFCEANLKHSKGEFAGRAFKLEKWQKKVIGHLFGWKHKRTNLRRFRKVLIYIPRKNGKSFITSALGLIGLVADNEQGAEIYCIASDTAQAALVFNEAASMVQQNEKLAEDIRVFKGYKAMKFEETASYWRVLSSTAASKHGLNPHLFICDELHTQKDSELIEVMETGTGTRQQPLGIYLTTADYSGDSPCNRMLDYAKKVRDGIIEDPTFLPVIYEAERDKDDWRDEKVWFKVNPNLGVSIKIDYFRQQFKKALEDPNYENTFKRLHLNMQTEQEKRWMQMHEWDASGQKIELEALKGKECFAGLDLSSTTDITAFVLYFPAECACIPFFWVPEATAKKRLEYEVWARDKQITITEGKTINYDLIREKIIELTSEYQIKDIAYDPWNASQLAIKLADTDGLPMIEFRQGYKSMNEPTKELYKTVLEHKLVHFNNPVLRWMASNAQVVEDPAGNVKLTKVSKDSQLKVDGIIALVMAMGLAINHKQEDKSVYDSDSDSFDKVLKEIYGK